MRRLARSPKRNKRKVVSGSRVTLPENFAYKPGLSFNPLARVTLAIGLPYLLVNRALVASGPNPVALATPQVATSSPVMFDIYGKKLITLNFESKPIEANYI